jgi:hypothetical protein
MAHTHQLDIESLSLADEHFADCVLVFGRCGLCRQTCTLFAPIDDGEWGAESSTGRCEFADNPHVIPERVYLRIVERKR